MRPNPLRRSRLAFDRLEDRLAPANIVWTGTRPTGLGTDWFAPLNWEVVGSNPIVNVVPGAGDDATVAGPSPAVVINGAAAARSLFFDRGAGLDINGSLALGSGGSSWTTFRLNGSSTLDIADGATIGTAFFPCAVVGTGSITNPVGRAFTVISATWDVPFTNQGTTVSHRLALTGPITAAPGSVFRVIGIAGTGNGSLSAASFTNQGTIELTAVNGVAGATFGVRNGAIFTHAAGALIAARVGAGNGQRSIGADTGSSLFTAGDWLIEPGVTLNVNIGVPFTWQGGSVSGGGILDLPNTIVAAGAVLDAPAEGSLALGANTVSGSGTFRVLPGRMQTFGNTTVSTAFVNQGTTVLTSTTLSGAVTNAAGATLRVVEAGNPGNMTTTAFANAGKIELTAPGRAWGVTAGSGTLTNDPTGVIDITGTGFAINAFGGGFLNRGTLNANVNATVSPGGSNSSHNAGLVTVAAGATLNCPWLVNDAGGTLRGSGTFTNVGFGVFTNAGTVSPGVAGPGVLTDNGPFTQTATGSLAVDLNGAVVGTEYDQLKVNGTVTLAGALTINPASTPAAGTVFTVIDNDGGDAVVGTFDGLPQNGTVVVGGTTYRISYTGGTGNDVTLTVLAPAAAPRVSGVAVNAGQSNLTQRSRVTSLTVTFSTQVTFAGNVADAFTVSRIGGGTVGGFTATATVANGSTVVTLTGFAGVETNFDSLADGRFAVSVRANQVTANGAQLDGDGNGTGGDDYVLNGTVTNGLYRLFGDVNADGIVNAFDFGQFRPTFGTSTGQAGYLDYLDFNGDGSINAFDFGQLRNRFGSGVP